MSSPRFDSVMEENVFLDVWGETLRENVEEWRHGWSWGGGGGCRSFVKTHLIALIQKQELLRKREVEENNRILFLFWIGILNSKINF